VYYAYPVYQPYRVYRPAPVYAPAPCGPVVYDRYHDRVDGYVSFGGPNFSVGIGF
jgi:hypothetical protein